MSNDKNLKLKKLRILYVVFLIIALVSLICFFVAVAYDKFILVSFLVMFVMTIMSLVVFLKYESLKELLKIESLQEEYMKESLAESIISDENKIKTVLKSKGFSEMDNDLFNFDDNGKVVYYVDFVDFCEQKFNEQSLQEIIDKEDEKFRDAGIKVNKCICLLFICFDELDVDNMLSFKQLCQNFFIVEKLHSADFYSNIVLVAIDKKNKKTYYFRESSGNSYYNRGSKMLDSILLDDNSF